jgi:hypothetical protein
MKDTDFHLGKRIEDIVERNPWAWTYRSTVPATWQPEYERWLWDWDIPVVADIGHDKIDELIVYRPKTKQWLIANGAQLNGPTMEEKDLPYPFVGRFLGGSTFDLGLWSLTTGTVTLRDPTGKEVSFKWGGRTGDVLVPGDYDGDGIDEIAVWQMANRTWYWKKAPDGAISQAVFGTESGIPLPGDYNHDGRTDLAYWEPRLQKIFVSYTLGRSIDLTIPVPPHSIPVFVNMY